jgi:hypothetical protein
VAGDSKTKKDSSEQNNENKRQQQPSTQPQDQQQSAPQPQQSLPPVVINKESPNTVHPVSAKIDIDKSVLLITFQTKSTAEAGLECDVVVFFEGVPEGTPKATLKDGVSKVTLEPDQVPGRRAIRIAAGQKESVEGFRISAKLLESMRKRKMRVASLSVDVKVKKPTEGPIVSRRLNVAVPSNEDEGY